MSATPRVIANVVVHGGVLGDVSMIFLMYISYIIFRIIVFNFDGRIASRHPVHYSVYYDRNTWVSGEWRYRESGFGFAAVISMSLFLRSSVSSLFWYLISSMD